MGEDQLKVGHFIFRWDKGVGFFKASIVFEQFVDFLEVGEVVAGGVNLSARFERAGDGGHKRFIEESVVMVFPFGPRVGIEDVVHIYGFFGNQVGGGVVAIDPEKPDVFSLEPPCLFVDFFDPVEHAVDPQKVHLGEFSGSRQKEAAFATADIDLERSFRMIKSFSEISRLKPLLRIYSQTVRFFVHKPRSFPSIGKNSKPQRSWLLKKQDRHPACLRRIGFAWMDRLEACPTLGKCPLAPVGRALL